jgi:hypothetical protein
MVNEVENILNEIRERVRKDHQHDEAQPSQSMPANGGPQHSLSLNSNVRASGAVEGVNSQSLNRLSAHLTTTSRAWDRLPPLYSNRRGGPARFELWIKARLKAMSRWFTWEQVNFNSAVHHALAETLQALSAYQQELAALRIELAKQTAESREGFERGNLELTTVRAGIEAQKAELRKAHANASARAAAIEARGAATEARGAAVEAKVAELTAELTRQIDETRADLTPRLAKLAGEFRESDQQLREEQRVCFKQLSLEAGETAVNEDRGRRLIEARLDKLEKALANIAGQ